MGGAKASPYILRELTFYTIEGRLKTTRRTCKMLILATEVAHIDWGTVIVQSLITLGVIFGGAGYWEYRRTKMQKKWDDESKKNGVEKQMKDMSDNFATLSTEVGSLNDKFDTLSADVKELKDDLEVLQKANEATVKYREMRDKQDKEAAIIQKAIIQSLTGILRERLLENYNRCIEKGYYTKEEREVYGQMYQCYINDPFRGNGVMHQLQPIMQDLPWTDEEAKARKAAPPKK